VFLLFAVPFLDRRRVRRVSERTTAIGVVLLVCAGWGALTAGAIASTPRTNAAGSSGGAELQTWSHFSPQELAGIGFFRQEQCGKCHNLAAGEPKPGPNLAGLETHKSTEWIFDHFKTESHLASAAGAGNLSTPQWIALSALVGKLSPERAVTLELTPENLTRGAEVYITNGCGNCHKVNAAGGQLGPPLNGLSGRRSKDWVGKHFVSPRALSPGSIMPPYRLPTADQDALTAYLFSLPP
jgi:ubiquinol-cytochrome c reductase cytochrome b subunit